MSLSLKVAISSVPYHYLFIFWGMGINQYSLVSQSVSLNIQQTSLPLCLYDIVRFHMYMVAIMVAYFEAVVRRCQMDHVCTESALLYDTHLSVACVHASVSVYMYGCYSGGSRIALLWHTRWEI